MGNYYCEPVFATLTPSFKLVSFLRLLLSNLPRVIAREQCRSIILTENKQWVVINDVFKLNLAVCSME